MHTKIIPGANLTNSLSHVYRVKIRIPKLKKKKISIIEDINFLIENLQSSVQQDFINKITNMSIMKFLKPNNRTKGRFGIGPLNMPGTIGIRNRYTIKCPRGSIRNKLGQCIYKTSLI
jgi:hypothetical protein